MDMKNALVVPSLKEGSDAKYVRLQAYIRHDEGVLHIQGKGPMINRDYGISWNIVLNHLDPNIIPWLDGIPRGYPSMADTGKSYFVLQMRYVMSTNQLNFQVQFHPIFNTTYGGCFGVNAPDHPGLLDFWNKVFAPAEYSAPKPAMVEEIEE